MSNTFGNITVYSLSELSNMLNVDPSFLKKECAEGKLKAKKIGEEYFVTSRDLEKYFENSKPGSVRVR